MAAIKNNIYSSFTKELIHKWRGFVIASFIIPLLLISFFYKALFKGDPLPGQSSSWILLLGWSGYILFLFLLISTIVILMNLERTLRASMGHIRWQIKFMLFGLGSIFVVRIFTYSQTLLFKSLDTGFDILYSGVLVVAGVLIIRSLARMKLLNLDVYLSHSFLYSSFTVLMVGIYLLVVGLFAKLITYLNWVESIHLKGFLIFLAFLGLSILLLSDRFRHKIRRFIAVQMKRPQYDYRREWIRFTEKTATITDAKNLCMTVARMVSDTLEVLSVTVWLLDEPHARLRPVGSTVSSETGAGQRILEEGEAKLIQAMKDQEMPVDLDDPRIPWAYDLKLSMPENFREARIRYCVPLSAGGNLLGVVTLGERVEYKPFSFEEFDLLKTIADQTAASLLNLKLSEDLRKAKEMEAFQTMSTFVVHDLKNLASTLSLTMQNLPIHFNNPDLRSDALQIIEQNVKKVNNLCMNLSILGQRIELKRKETDLNELVNASLSSMNGFRKISLIQNLQPLPKLVIDPEQIQKVLTNLILNANEAVENGGEIKVTTSQRDSWSILSVYDNGCGMSKEFMEQSLFRPFKTTKRQGMGIGLFQSKMIVEAHQGRIEVESEEGRGTTFRVFLPLAGK
jgi:putative PEP-CTERM system histidine kinase